MKVLLAVLTTMVVSSPAFARVSCECWGLTNYNNWNYVTKVRGYDMYSAERTCMNELDRHGKWNYIVYVNHWLGRCRWY